MLTARPTISTKGFNVIATPEQLLVTDMKLQHGSALQFIRVLLWACVLLACLPTAATQPDPTALTSPSALAMAKTIMDPRYWRIIASGPRKPLFSGPAGSAKLITDWQLNDAVENEVAPSGALKLTTPGADGRPAKITLKFSAILKVLVT
jgi:hypothetical protein